MITVKTIQDSACQPYQVGSIYQHEGKSYKIISAECLGEIENSHPHTNGELEWELNLSLQLFVVTYDNGSGYREWASSPCYTPEDAWKASGWKPGDEPWLGADPRVEDVSSQVVVKE